MHRQIGSTRIGEGTTAVKWVVQAFVLAVGIALAATVARSQVTFFTPVTDNVSYNVGSEVRVKVVLPPTDHFGSAPINISANVRYAGEQKYLEDKNVVIARGVTLAAKESATAYYPLWKIPEDARTGRYEVVLELSGSTPVMNAQQVPVTSFSVYRKLVKIERIRLGKVFYAPGDAVSCAVDLKNLSGHAISDLRVEFSDRYWPWTAQTSERAGVDVETIAQGLSLPSGGEQHLESAQAAVAKMPKPPEQPQQTPEAKAAAAKRAKEPAVQQYAVVVWDGARRNIYDIAFSSEVFIQPAGITEPRPYPLQYVYPSLDDVNVTSYRHFYPAGLDSAAIQLDREHTMYPSGSEATVRFSLRNPTSQPWRGVAVRARLLDSKGKELATKQIATGVNLDPGSAAVAEDATFTLPAGQSGIFRAQVEVNDASGETLATNVLELAANPLPHSILIFCAHQDDEGAHAGDRKSTRLNSSHPSLSRMPSSA